MGEEFVLSIERTHIYEAVGVEWFLIPSAAAPPNHGAGLLELDKESQDYILNVWNTKFVFALEQTAAAVAAHLRYKSPGRHGENTSEQPKKEVANFHTFPANWLLMELLTLNRFHCPGEDILALAGAAGWGFY